jgi:hypothetical protein
MIRFIYLSFIAILETIFVGIGIVLNYPKVLAAIVFVVIIGVIAIARAETSAVPASRFESLDSDPFLLTIPNDLIPAITHTSAATGIATVYGLPSDKKWGSGHLACAPDFRVQTLPTMNVCAHRTYRCGTILAVENPRTKQRTLCRVLDRGPYGAIMDDGTWGLKIRPSDPGRWRGIADLTPTVSAAIGHRGYERVKIWPVYIPDQKMIIKPKKPKKQHPVRENRVGV